MRILRLFPDTNVFLQCKNLNELDWSAWSDFDEIHLIVCHVVQREIDRHKTGHKGRSTKRARSTASRFRKIILGHPGSDVVRREKPLVFLYVDHQYSHSSTLPLDYTINDNQLVGTVHAASVANPRDDVRLVTHDTFPLATARGLGLKAEVVPDEWLLPPETTTHEKTIRELQARLDLLRAQEPRCTIEWLDIKDNDLQIIEHEHSHFPAIDDAAVSQLLQRIEAEFPLQTDFGMSAPQRRTVEPRHIPIVQYQEEYVPAKEEDIKQYREKYSEWIDECRTMLANYHFNLQRIVRRKRALLALKNVGTRPAKDALVTLTVGGQFHIVVHDDSSADLAPNAPDYELERHIGKHPNPPRGRWVSSLSQLTAVLGSMNWNAIDSLTPSGGHTSSFRIPEIPSVGNDPNEFYFSDGNPGTPEQYIRLGCDQWRHGGSHERFAVEITGIGSNDRKGVVTCRVEATNLSESVTKVIPVAIVAREMDTISHAVRDLDSVLRKTHAAEQPAKAEG